MDKKYMDDFGVVINGTTAELKPVEGNKYFENWLGTQTVVPGITISDVQKVRKVEKEFGVHVATEAAAAFKEMFTDDSGITKATVIAPFGKGDSIKTHNIAVVCTKDAKYRNPGDGSEGVNTRLQIFEKRPSYMSTESRKELAADIRASFTE